MQGRSQQVGRGLQTIASRVVKNEEALKKYDVAIKDNNGNLLSTYEILKNLKPKWDSMSDSERVALGNTLAGVNQYKVLASVMSAFDVAVETNNSTLDANGTTMKQNAIYMDSLKAKLTQLKAEFEKLVLGDGGLQSFAKTIVNVSSSVIKLINDVGGLKTVFLAISSVSIISKFSEIEKMFKSVSSISNVLKTKIIALSLAMIQSGTTTKSLSACLAEYGIVVNTTKLAVSSFLVVLTASIMIYNKIKTAQEEAIQKSKEVMNQKKSELESINEVINKVKNEKLSREELIEILDENFDYYGKEISKMEDVNKMRQSVIDKLEEERKARAKELVETGQGAFEKAFTEENYGYKIKNVSKVRASEMGINLQGNQKYSEAIENLKKYKNKLLELREDLKDENGYVDKTSGAWKAYNNRITEVENEISRLNDKHKENKAIIEAYQSALGENGQIYDGHTDKIREMTDVEWIWFRRKKELAEISKKNGEYLDEESESLSEYELKVIELAGSHGVLIDDLKTWAKELSTTEVELVEYADAMGVSVEQAVKFKQTQNNLTDSMNNIKNGYDICSKAIDEYNKNGGYSIDTLQSLLTLSPEWINALAKQGDKTKNLKELTDEKVASYKEEAKQMVYNQGIARLNALASRGMKEQTDETTKSVGFATQTMQAYTDTLKHANEEAFIYASKNGLNKEASEIMQDIQNQIKAIEDMTNSMFSSTNKSTSKANKETEKTTDLVNAVTTAYARQIDVIKEAKSSEVDEIEKAIDALEKERDETVKSSEKKIEALKREKEATIDAVEKKIKLLKKEKEAIVDSYKAQIDYLKEQKSDSSNTYKKEIDALKELKDARKEYWDEQLDALARENSETEKNLDLMKAQEALAQAKQKRVMVFKDGKFQYGENEAEISKAQESLNETIRKQEYDEKKQLLQDLRDAEIKSYEDRITAREKLKSETEEYFSKQIDALEKQRDEIKDQYEKQIDNLEEYKDMLKEQYEAQIQLLEDQKDTLKENYEAQIADKKEHKEKIKAEYDEQIKNLETERDALKDVLQNITDEQKKQWKTQLTQLEDFVKEWNRNIASMNYSSVLDSNGKLNVGAITSNISGNKTKAESISKHASGSNYIGDDELALIGDNPKYREIVIGSKLNNDMGTLTALKKGSGVVNSMATNTLASLLNGINGTNSSFKERSITNNSKGINIGTINLPEVKDGNGFIKYLQNFAVDMTQMAYT